MPGGCLLSGQGSPILAFALTISTHGRPFCLAPVWGVAGRAGLVGLPKAQKPFSDRCQQLRNVAADKPLTVPDHLGNFQHTS